MKQTKQSSYDASEEMRCHRNIVCTAVTQDALALKYASQKTRDFVVTDPGVQRDRRIENLEKRIKFIKTDS